MIISENTLIMKMTVDPLCEHYDKIYALPAFVIRMDQSLLALCKKQAEDKGRPDKSGVEVGSTLNRCWQ